MSIVEDQYSVINIRLLESGSTLFDEVTLKPFTEKFNVAIESMDDRFALGFVGQENIKPILEIAKNLEQEKSNDLINEYLQHNKDSKEFLIDLSESYLDDKQDNDADYEV